MRIAFYAPLKPPDHPVPSGDRRVARLLMAALQARGHQVEIAAHLRSYDRTGDEGRQQRLRMLGGRLAARLVRRYRARPLAERPAVWFTYHLYHKAPDWLGPEVAGGLGIPYVVAEASHAPKRRGGPWHVGFEGASDALSRADAVIGFNPRDAACVRPVMKSGARLLTLRPFLDLDQAAEPVEDRESLAAAWGVPAEEPWLRVK